MGFTPTVLLCASSNIFYFTCRIFIIHIDLRAMCFFLFVLQHLNSVTRKMNVAILPVLASGGVVVWPGPVSMSVSSGDSSSSLDASPPALHAQPHASHGTDAPMVSEDEDEDERAITLFFFSFPYNKRGTLCCFSRSGKRTLGLTCSCSSALYLCVGY